MKEGCADLSANALTTGEKKILLSPPFAAGVETATMIPSRTSPALPTGDGPAMIAKSLEVKGEVICSDWLYIDGKVEGAISLPGGRVTVSRDAQVAANISAREVVVLGKVSGNIDASDRVDSLESPGRGHVGFVFHPAGALTILVLGATRVIREQPNATTGR